MAQFDRYMLKQLLLSFGFFALVLVLIYWVNRAVLLFDRLIANGENTGVFVELTILTLPSMIAIVLPVAGFTAAIFVTNRLSAENELVVAQSSGFGPYRMARPVLIFGLLTGLFLMALNHVLVPKSQERLALRRAEIAQNITARFLTEGTFVHPTRGTTIYVREITRDGEMLDIFLSDSRDPANSFIYSAERALIVRSQTGPHLVLFKGMVQVLSRDADRLTITSFDDFSFNLSSLTTDGFLKPQSLFFLSTPDLFRAHPTLLASLGVDKTAFLHEAHARSARALTSVVAALIGFSTLLLGGFSRFGLWRQIVAAILLLGAMMFLDNIMLKLAATSITRVGLVYVPSLIGLVVVAGIMWYSPRLTLFNRRGFVRGSA